MSLSNNTNIKPNTTDKPSEASKKVPIQANHLSGIYSVYEKNNSPFEFVGDKTNFWGNNPNVLIRSFDLFPTDSMTFTEKINALARLIIVLSVILALIFQRITFVLMGILTLFLIWVYYVSRTAKREGFGEAVLEDISGGEFLMENADEIVFDKPTASNPFSNVLMTDYIGRPDKPPAPPIYEPKNAELILQKAKEMVQKSHPNFPDISDKLFSNLGDQFQFEQSLQPFYSCPSTTIPNDQKAFTDFCYGDLISCKEGNLFACSRNLPRYGPGN